jgi:hypothetical protein
MLYRISYGPTEARLTEATESIAFAAARYCELADRHAVDIELLVEGMPLDPGRLLKALPGEVKHFAAVREEAGPAEF